MRLKNRINVLLAGLVLVAAMTGLTSCVREKPDRTEDGRVIVEYWEKWEDFEKDAMRAVVDKYNASQDKVFVKFLSTGQIEQKLLLATSGGNPPDVAGFWAWRLYTYADMGALEPLDGLIERDGFDMDRYLPVISEQCEHHGFIWGLPSTPATLALHYNTDMFREAGLDPNRPPRTIAELDEYAAKLTKIDEDGEITQLGFSPTEPGWWNERWCYWFGGRLVSKDGTKIVTDSPENIAAYDWVQSYPEKYGFKTLQVFQSAGGQFSSAQNLFISGKVAMELQGVWMANFVEKYNPDLNWAVAPFPSSDPELKDVTICEADVLVIPRGARHKEEAWDFIKFVQRQENMEMLCLGQRKFSPLREVSEDFYKQHPNPYIRVFRNLAESPNARYTPKTQIFNELRDEFTNAFDLIWRDKAEPDEALTVVRERIQPKLDRALQQWKRIAEERKEEWRSEE
ncbi:ABC transporter substrate-binding protein [bacterium]|nr:ABC transporter substrate-binding protein [bacterium]